MPQTPAITIVVVNSHRLLRKFIDFPLSLYKGNPYFTPYIFEDEIDNLTPGKNPANKYCDFRLFLAYRGKTIVGRVCGIINRFANEKYHQKRVRFNRIDMIDDIEVTKALLGAVEAWGKENGLTEINGPLGYSDQDKEGLLTKGFDQHNMFATFYTHPYYVTHLESLGFKVDATWVEYRLYFPENLDAKFTKLADYAKKKFNVHLVHIKSKRKKHLKPYVYQVLGLVNRAYKDLYGYVPIDEKQMDHLADMTIPLINLDYLQVVCDENEKVVAFGLMMPTPVFALKKCNGHLLPFGWIGMLSAIKHSKVLDMLLIAIEPELKNSGILTIVFEAALKNAIKNKVKYAETGPELEYNTNVQALWKSFRSEQHKTRSAFLKSID